MSRARHRVVSHARRRMAIRVALGGSVALILASPAVPANAAEALASGAPALVTQIQFSASAIALAVPVTGMPSAVRTPKAALKTYVVPRLATNVRFGSINYNFWYARSVMAVKFHWYAAQFVCLVNLWQRESGWNQYAHNGSSGAHGIPQAVPGAKMASAGSNWRTDPRVQIRWGLGYIRTQYETPCTAWKHWQHHNWY